MIEKWLLIALIAFAAAGAAYFQGRSDGSQKYYALVANLDRTTTVIKKVTAAANTTRKKEKAEETQVFAGLDLKLGEELAKVTPVLGCAIPDDQRVRLTDAISETANAALRVRQRRETDPKEVATP